MSTSSTVPIVSNVQSIHAGRRHLAEMLTEWTGRYPNRNTATAYYAWVDKLFLFAGTTDPERLTETHLAQWATTGTPANNTVRAKLIAARAFLTWCKRRGYDIQEMDFAQLRKSYPRTYGKVQAPFPARFLSREEFARLIEACKDGTWQGSKDQLIIRLGTHGLRLSEIARLRWADVNGDQLHWIGKGNRPRTVTASPTLTAQLAAWHRYLEKIGGEVIASDPVVAKTQRQGSDNAIIPHVPTVAHTIRDRIAYRAQLAGLGHIAPHDLRRTCASFLHSARTADGGHHFDLRDVQHMLGHASPETTDRSYLSQLDRDNLDRAAQHLDG